LPSDFFGAKFAFLKDGVEFASFNYEILDDLTFKSPNNTIFKGPELGKDAAVLELMTMLKNNYEEVSAVPLEKLIEIFTPLVAGYKVKSWDGEYLPFY